MVRKDKWQAISLEIFTRSQSVSANRKRFRDNGRIPPVGDNKPNIEEDSMTGFISAWCKSGFGRVRAFNLQN